MKVGVVAIAGRPNAGKSTLMNALLGSKISIVSEKAQTTRERVHGILTEEDRGQILFVDTPGIHRAREGGINAYMMTEVRQALDAPNLVWYLVDPNSAIIHENLVLEALVAAKAPVAIVLNKTDLKTPKANGEKLAREVEIALKEQGVDVKAVIPVSALKKRGLHDLLALTWESLPEGEPLYPDAEQISDRPVRYFVAEQIREQLFYCLGDELPYSCAVEIQKFKEEAKPLRIEAAIHVERESQKGMVIGAGGAKIKEIGTRARGTIEKFLEQKIFLGLTVKVSPDWSKDPQRLEALGYALPKAAKQAAAKKDRHPS